MRIDRDDDACEFFEEINLATDAAFTFENVAELAKQILDAFTGRNGKLATGGAFDVARCINFRVAVATGIECSECRPVALYRLRQRGWDMCAAEFAPASAGSPGTGASRAGRRDHRASGDDARGRGRGARRDKNLCNAR